MSNEASTWSVWTLPSKYLEEMPLHTNLTQVEAFEAARREVAPLKRHYVVRAFNTAVEDEVDDEGFQVEDYLFDKVTSCTLPDGRVVMLTQAQEAQVWAQWREWVKDGHGVRMDVLTDDHDDPGRLVMTRVLGPLSLEHGHYDWEGHVCIPLGGLRRTRPQDLVVE